MTMILVASIVLMSVGCGLVSVGNSPCRAIGLSLIIIGYGVALALIPSVVVGMPQ